MTARDRKHIVWIRDFLDDQLGAVEYAPTIRRMKGALAMFNRMLAADDKKRARRGAP